MQLHTQIQKGIPERLRGSLGTPEKMKRQSLGRFMANARKLRKFFNCTLEWGGEKRHRSKDIGLRPRRHVQRVCATPANPKSHLSVIGLILIAETFSNNATGKTPYCLLLPEKADAHLVLWSHPDDYLISRSFYNLLRPALQSIETAVDPAVISIG
jgi:hypothetical protein